MYREAAWVETHLRAVKMREMEWLIKREKGDLDMSIASAQNMSGDEEAERQLMGKINIQRRKIAMKEKILDEFKRKLGVS